MVSDSSNMAQNFAMIEQCGDDHGGRWEQDLIDHRGAGPPHKGQTLAVRWVPSVGFIFISF